MMSWLFRENNQEVRRALNRLVNTSATVESYIERDATDEKRVDSRIARNTPVIILPLAGNADDLNLGITTDISEEGMGLNTLGPLQVGCELSIGVGTLDEFSVFLAECKRTRPIGFGYFESGVQVHQVLPAKNFAPLLELAKHLEENPPTSLFGMTEPV